MAASRLSFVQNPLVAPGIPVSEETPGRTRLGRCLLQSLPTDPHGAGERELQLWPNSGGGWMHCMHWALTLCVHNTPFVPFLLLSSASQAFLKGAIPLFCSSGDSIPGKPCWLLVCGDFLWDVRATGGVIAITKVNRAWRAPLLDPASLSRATQLTQPDFLPPASRLHLLLKECISGASALVAGASSLFLWRR